jgi:hypothetical protein
MKPLAFALVVGLAPCADARAAFVIDDRSFFSGIEHDSLDFESRGDGAALNLFPGQSALIPSDEYASAGIRFGTPFAWGHIGAPPSDNPDFAGGASEAVDAAGSWPTIIGGAGDTWTIEFTKPILAFGTGVVQLGFAGSAEPSEDATTTVDAFSASGKLLGRVTLWLDTVDGGFGGPYAGGRYGDEWSEFSYGFIGLAADEPIARIELRNVFSSILDDFHVSAVPSPGTTSAVALFGIGVLIRRRRL